MARPRVGRGRLFRPLSKVDVELILQTSHLATGGAGIVAVRPTAEVSTARVHVVPRARKLLLQARLSQIGVH